MALWEAYLAPRSNASDFRAPLRAQVARDYRVVNTVIPVNEMGPGTLVRTPVPCARVMMTLASRGKLPQITITIPITITITIYFCSYYY